MSKTIQEHLEFVYGSDTTGELLPRIEELINHHKKSNPPRPAESPAGQGIDLDQTRSLLITYGDQVQGENQTHLQCLADFCNRHLQGIVGGVHILPFYPYTSDDGFSVVDYRKVDPNLGTWEDLQLFTENFDLMYDAVFNHISSQSDWFKGFLKGDEKYTKYFVVIEGDPDLSEVVRPRTLPLLTSFPTAEGEKKVWTTFSADQIDVNARHPELLLELLDILLFYIRSGARFIRLDAIAFLWKEIGTSCIHLPQTHRIIQLMRSVLEEAAPHALLITETNVPHEHNVSYFGDGTNEAQLVYNFALPPLVMHGILTGDGTYLTQWAKSLSLPTNQVTFFNFLASHDGVGVNPARGILSEEEIHNVLVRAVENHGGFVSNKTNPDGSESPYELNINYFDALSDPNNNEEPLQLKIDRFLLAQSIMLSFQGMPGIYFHSLFGSKNDRKGAETSGIPRRINRQKFSSSAIEKELADPESLRARVFGGYKKLLKIRNARKAFHAAGAQVVLEDSPKVFAILREAPDGSEKILALHNLSGEAVQWSMAKNNLQGPLAEGSTDLLGSNAKLQIDSEKIHVDLAPYQTFWANL